MNAIQKLSLTTLTVAVAAAASVTPASAQYSQQQRQSFSSETSFSSNCEGSNCSGKSEFKSSTNMAQEQRQGSGVGMNGWSHSNNGSNWNGWDNWDEEETNTAGEVRLNWTLRDGTCYIQYRNVGTAGWPYSTQANCNDCGITVGGLQEGKNYQFRIKKNDGPWSRVMTRRAW